MIDVAVSDEPSVLIKRGDWNRRVIRDVTFRIAGDVRIRRGNQGPFFLVDGTGLDGYPQRNFRIMVSGPSDYVILDPRDNHAPDATRSSMSGDPALSSLSLESTILESSQESDDQIRERILERFHILRDITGDVARGHIKGLVVSGASGVGKSHEVEAALNRDSLMDKLSFNADASDQDSRRVHRDGGFKARYNIIKGYSTAPALYATLHEYSESRETLVFDDCDAVLGDETSLNLLKAALDTSGKRVISWKSLSRNSTDAPDQFEFNGSVIFITNINFERIVERGTARLAPHLDAIMSRCLYLDLTIDSVREKMVRIEHVARDLRMLETQFRLSESEAEEVLEWTQANARRFRELSLRKVGQLASLRKSKSLNWRRTAEITLLRQR